MTNLGTIKKFMSILHLKIVFIRTFSISTKQKSNILIINKSWSSLTLRRHVLRHSDIIHWIWINGLPIVSNYHDIEYISQTWEHFRIWIAKRRRHFQLLLLDLSDISIKHVHNVGIRRKKSCKTLKGLRSGAENCAE